MTEQSNDTAIRASEVSVFIDPPSHHFYGDALFDRDNERLNRDGILLPFVALRDWLVGRGVQVHTADYLLRGEARNKCNLYLTLGIYDNYSALAKMPEVTLSAVFQFECPIVEPAAYRALGRAQMYFRHIYSWSDSASLERFVGGPLGCERFCWPQPFEDVHDEIWRRTERKHLVLINSNKLPRLSWQELYSERLRAIEFFARRGEIDLYGMGWDQPPMRMGRSRLPWTLIRAQRWVNGLWQRLRPDPLLCAARRVYRGPLASKAETLGRYNFAICFENMILKGWLTEKIFDCFYSGTVPIYWGTPDIDEHVPPDCFIDMRAFGSYEALGEHLRCLGPADIARYREAARDFLRSPRFRPFTTRAFVETVAGVIERDSGVDLGLGSGGNSGPGSGGAGRARSPGQS